MAFFQTMGTGELWITLLVYVLPIWALIDMARRPDEGWRRIGQSRLAWTILALFLGPLGALLYLILVRPRLRRAASAIPSPPAEGASEPEPDRIGGEDRG